MTPVVPAVERAGIYFPVVLDIIRADVGHIEIIIHLLLDDEVRHFMRYAVDHLRRHPVEFQRIVFYIVFIIAEAVIVTQVGVDGKRIVEPAGVLQLRDVGIVIVRFVIVITPSSRFILIFAGGIVPAPVFFYLGRIDPFPSDARALLSLDVAQANQLIIGVMRQGSEQVVMVDKAVADISLAGVARKAGVERKSVFQDSRAGRDARCKRVVAARRCGSFAVSFGAGADSFQRNAGAESTRPVCGGSDSALYLNALQRARQVGQIDPKNILAFGIIQRHAVQRDVDAAGIDPPDAHVAVSRSRTVFTVRNERRNVLQKNGNVARGVVFFNLRLRNIRIRHRRVFAGSCGGYDHLFQLYVF